MCGIVGIVDFSGAPIDADLLRRMTRAVAHRGPDGEAIWVGNEAGLGHRRLAIRDLSDGGRQPISDPSGRVVVTYNGEIYNLDDLRRDITAETGYQFRTRCDAEILPIGWLRWGTSLFSRLEGMFAIGLWDNSTRELVLVRDAAGVKPLYLCEYGRRAVFASEIKGLFIDPDVPRKLDPRSVKRYLAQGFVGPNATLVESVQAVAPGTIRIIGAHGTATHTFWRPKRRPTIKSMPEAAEGFREVFDEVVHGMLVSDVPVGLLQSGGIDSSLISLHLGKVGRFPAFTAAFSNENYDESAVAAQVAELAGHETRVIRVDYAADLEADFKAVAWHFDGQVADSSGLALYRLSREVRRHVSVVFSGEGADELFAGYPTYRASRLAEVVAPCAPTVVWRQLAKLFVRASAGSEKRLSAFAVAERWFNGLASPRHYAHAAWRRLAPEETIQRIAGVSLEAFEAEDGLEGYRAALDQTGHSTIDRCLLADQLYYLPSDMLMKVDAMSMAHNLEARVPFLDRRLMDFAGQLHPALLSPMRGPDKKLLRIALQRLGAPRHVYRSPKRGFNVPVAALLRGPLRPLANRILVREGDRLSPFIDAAGVKQVWSEHANKERDHGYLIWALLNLGTWMEQAF